MFVRTVLATLALALAAPVQADFREGALAYSRGDYATALKELEPLAAQGDASAQYLVGAARSNAKPPLQDIAQAEKWLRSAAAQGHLKAMVSLGNLFAFYTQPPDYKQALDWFKKAAERCDPEGQFMTALGRFEGKTLAKDLPSAWMWLTLASLRGHLIAAVTQHAIRDKFSAADIAAGNERARRWHCQP
jgi:TPR repeat protein